MNQTQFNGHFGCPYCFHQGTTVDSQMKYTYEANTILRTNETTRRDMLKAFSKREIASGFFGLSAFYTFDEFNLVWQFVIDKMHNADLGVVPKLFSIWLIPKNRSEG